jgi:hypothetical protein
MVKAMLNPHGYNRHDTGRQHDHNGPERRMPNTDHAVAIDQLPLRLNTVSAASQATAALAPSTNCVGLQRREKLHTPPGVQPTLGAREVVELAQL